MLEASGNDRLELQQRFTALPARILLGTALLQRRSQGESLTEQEVVDASLDVIDYQKGCSSLRQKLAVLQPIPAAIDCMEFGL